MLSPTTLISIFRWTLFILTICVSIFVSRWLGFGLLLSLLAWELSARFLAPLYFVKKLKKRRLRSQIIRNSLPLSLWAHHKGEAELLELSTEWPVALIIQQKNPKLFFNPILGQKLNNNEILIVLDWMFLLSQRQVSSAALQLLLILTPATFLLKIFDKLGLSSSQPESFKWERSFHRLIAPILSPLFKEHNICLELLAQRHDSTKVNRLRDKLNHLVKAHGQWPPADIAYLCLEPQYIFKKKSFYYFLPATPLKESIYGTKT